MKLKFLIIFLMFIAASLACQVGAPPVDTEATVAAAIQATQAAVHTATPIPSSTPTEPPTPTEAPLPTETPAPVEPPTSTALPTGPTISDGAVEGWTRYDFLTEGFSISLPPNWQQLTADPETMDAIMEAAGDANENLESIMSSEMIQTMIAQGVKLMALDASIESLTSSTPTNVNVLTTELPITVDLDTLIDLTLVQLEQIFTPLEPIQHERVILGPDQLEAEHVIYKVEQVNALGQTVNNQFEQYILLDEKVQYVITFTASIENAASQAPLFEEIAHTFELLD